jgi:hypothetical protein
MTESGRRYWQGELRWKAHLNREALRKSVRDGAPVRRSAKPHDAYVGHKRRASGRAALELAKVMRARLGQPPSTRTCPMCAGSGRRYDLGGILSRPCPNCGGTGRVSAKSDSGGGVNTEAPGGGGAGASEGGGMGGGAI